MLITKSSSNTHIQPFYGPLDFVRDYPGEPGPEPICILLKQETANGSGISWAICKSAPQPRQITMPSSRHSDRMPFLPPNQQRQRTEGIKHFSKQVCFQFPFKNIQRS